MVCNNVAWLLAERREALDEALKLAKLAAGVGPDYVNAQDTLGWVHYQRGEYPAAIAVLERAKVTAPTRADIAAHLGLAYVKAGRKAEAFAELQRALKDGPRCPIAPRSNARWRCCQPAPRIAEIARSLRKVIAGNGNRGLRYFAAGIVSPA